jgi:hypothetical protein
MATIQKPVHVIGVSPAELPALRLMIALLRHPDPSIGELARQALLYLQEVAARSGSAQPEKTGSAQ